LAAPYVEVEVCEEGSNVHMCSDADKYHCTCENSGELDKIDDISLSLQSIRAPVA
jgi:hypothetical protein